MRHKNINHVVHEWLDELIHSNDIIVDATCGQGYDTLFCLHKGAHVIGFDIQKEAIFKTKQTCAHFPNLQLINDSHAHLNRYLTHFNGIIFNLGYLPTSDKTIITTAESTLLAFENALDCLPQHGWMVVSFYRGHKGGEEEAQLGIQWMNEHLHIQKTYTYEGVNRAPIAMLGIKR